MSIRVLIFDCVIVNQNTKNRSRIPGVFSMLYTDSYIERIEHMLYTNITKK